MSQDWDIKPCNTICSGCETPFKDQGMYVSKLVFSESGYERADYCEECHGREPVEQGTASHSSWKGTFQAPAPPEEALKKETAESLLRKLMESDDKSNGNTIYVLAVMLERKKILVERDIKKRQDGSTTIVYEHRKTGETFLVPDPGLKLTELESVQQEVMGLLGGAGDNAGPQDSQR